jgi:hypothetical protein
MPNPSIASSTLVGDTSEEIIRLAVASRRPDRDVPEDDVARWLALQERIEIRTELAARGLL